MVPALEVNFEAFFKRVFLMDFSSYKDIIKKPPYNQVTFLLQFCNISYYFVSGAYSVTVITSLL